MAGGDVQNASPTVSLISGGAAGGIEAAITYPIELAKVSRNPCRVVWNIYSQEGLGALYRGCGVQILGSIGKDAVRFASFAHIRDAFKDQHTGQLTPWRSLAAGIAAGVVASATAVTPSERLKTALIDDARSASPKFRGAWHTVRVIVREDRLLGLYRGFAGTTLKQAGATGFRMGSYNIIKNFERGLGWEDVNSVLVSFANGAVAGMITTLATQPFDTIKTRSQAAKATTTLEAVKGILRDEGLAGFYKGTVLRLSRTVVAGGILFTSAEAVTKLISPFFPT